MRGPTMGEAEAGLFALASAHGSLASFQAAAQSLLLALFQSHNYGLNTLPPRTAREFVASLYDAYLLRPPTDLAGWDFWTNQIISNGDNQAARAAVLAAFAALSVNNAESEFGLKTRALWEATAGGTMTPLTGANSTLQAVNRTTLVTVTARDAANNVASVTLQLEGVLPYPPDFNSPVEEDDPATLSLAADNHTRIVGYTGRRKRKWSCKYGKHILAQRDGLRSFLAWHRLDKYFWLIDKGSGFEAKVVLDSKRSYNALRQHLHGVEFALVEYDDGSPLAALPLPPQPDACISDTIPRLAPSNLSATLNGNSQIDLAWTRNANDNTGVEVQFRAGTGAWQTLATLGAGVTSYAHTGLATGTTYEYRARNTWNDAPTSSAWSGTAFATTPAAPRPAPSNLTATALSASEIELEWDVNALDNNGMVVEWRQNNTGAWNVIPLAAGQGFYQHNGRSPSTLYAYRVKNTWNAAPTESGYSNTATATTQNGDPAPYVVSINRAAGYANPRSDGSMRWRVTFSEPVTGLLTSHFVLTVVSGSLVDQFVDSISPVAGSNGAAYDVDVSDAVGTGVLRLDLPANSAIKDSANNPLATSFNSGQTFTIDQTAPTLVSAVALSDAYTIQLTYNEALDAASVPPASAFAVHSQNDPVVYSNGVHISGAVVTLDLDNAIVGGETVTIDYTPPGSGKIRDALGNNAAALSGQSVTNNVSGGGSSLLNNLIAFYNLTETSGQRNDSSSNARHLTDDNSNVGNAAGHINSTAAAFPGGARLSSNSSAFNPGTGDFELAFWFKLNNVSSFQTLVSKGAGNVDETYWVYANNDGLYCQFQNPTGTGINLSTTGLAANTWYFCDISFDRDGDGVMRLDNAVVSTAAMSSIAGDASSSLNFCVGGFPTTTGALTLQGRLEALGAWARLLTSTERDALWNSGNGNAWPL